MVGCFTATTWRQHEFVQVSFTVHFTNRSVYLFVSTGGIVVEAKGDEMTRFINHVTLNQSNINFYNKALCSCKGKYIYVYIFFVL